MSNLYPKISSPYKRFTDGPMRNRLDVGTWSKPEFNILSGLDWTWTEKVDGTNVRVIWDGYRVTFGGRTDNAQMPVSLLKVLGDLFPEELLEQQFGANPAVLYGEGYGPKIQKGGGNYRQDQSFVLFDVMVGDWWLLPGAVAEVGQGLKLDVVPTVFCGPIRMAIDAVTEGVRSNWGPFWAEGLVGRPPLGLTSRDGDRLLVKVKTKDFAASD